MHFAAIADDITGATDLASVCRKAGLNTVQTVGIPETSLPRADVVVMSLKIRTAPAAEAVSAAQRAADLLRAAGAEHFYFKYCSTFDSTDRGNIGPVMHGLQQKLGAPFTIACPAYPGQRRTVYRGHLFVGDVLLSDSSMRHHPLTPMTDANLVRVLGRQYPGRVGLVPFEDVDAGVKTTSATLNGLEVAGYRAAVVDALTDRHVATIAESASGLMLATGGAALGGALAACYPRGTDAGTGFSGPTASDGTVAVLSGSCSAATLAQLDNIPHDVPRRRVDPAALAEDPHALSTLLEWARDQARISPHFVLYSSADAADVARVQARLGRSEAAFVIEDAFQQLARVVADAGVRVFVVAGGETSGAVLQALGIRSLEFGRELAPGVPWTRSLDPAGYCLALKSGNFGGTDFFVRALQDHL
jgi:uncharacterized protein YgbK (DUF1537 family)